MKKYEELLKELDNQAYTIRESKQKVAEDSLVEFLVLLTKISKEYGAYIGISPATFLTYIDVKQKTKIPNVLREEINNIEMFLTNRIDIYENYLWDFLVDGNIKEIRILNGDLYASRSNLDEKLAGLNKDVRLHSGDIKSSFYIKYEKELLSDVELIKKSKGFRV